MRTTFDLPFSRATQIRGRTLAAAVTALIALAPAGADAQQAQSLGGGVALRPVVGAFIPTGKNRDVLDDAVLMGAQLSYHVSSNFSVLGSFAWSPSTDRTTWGPTSAPNVDEDLDVFQYDLGVEGRLPNAVGGASWALSPFAAVGAGGRTYHYRDIDAQDAETNVVGYVGLGTDIAPRIGAWGIRVEARDYISAFKGLRGELSERKARNDVVLTAGLTYRFGAR